MPRRLRLFGGGCLGARPDLVAAQPSSLLVAKPLKQPPHVCCLCGAGYVGSHTVVKLLENGFRVSIMDSSNVNPKVIDRLREITCQDVPLFKVDMRDVAGIDELFAREKFTGVIHFSGLKAVEESTTEPLGKIDGTLNILNAMVKHHCKAIVFSWGPLGCMNPYGWTKYMEEQLLIDNAKAHPELSVSILRYSNPAGAHPSGRIGDCPGTDNSGLMSSMQQVAVGRRECLSVFGDDYDTPDGTGVRDYIHVDDLAEGHVAALQRILMQPGSSSIRILGSGKGASVLDMVKAFEKASGKTIPYKLVGRRRGDLGRVIANPVKAKRELDWETKRTLEDMCSSAWKWQSENPYGYDTAPLIGL